MTVGWLQLTIGLADFIFNMLSFNFSDTMYRLNGLIIFLIVPLTILITSYLYLGNKDQSYRFVAIGAVPYMLLYLTSALIGPEAVFLDTSALAFSKWLGANFRLVEMITLGFLIVCFTWVLFLRFSQLRRENAQQSSVWKPSSSLSKP